MAKFAKELQSAKALFPMWVTESGMVKFVKELQLVKAKSTMWVTELGMVKLAKGLQPQKAPPQCETLSLEWSSLSVKDEIVKLTNALQSAKAKSAMWVTESGMVKSTTELQSRNV